MEVPRLGSVLLRQALAAPTVCAQMRVDGRPENVKVLVLAQLAIVRVFLLSRAAAFSQAELHFLFVTLPPLLLFECGRNRRHRVYMNPISICEDIAPVMRPLFAPLDAKLMIPAFTG